jgi:hypothetical protein
VNICDWFVFCQKKLTYCSLCRTHTAHRLQFESSLLRYYLVGNLATMCVNAGHLKAAACKILFSSNKTGPKKSCITFWAPLLNIYTFVTFYLPPYLSWLVLKFAAASLANWVTSHIVLVFCGKVFAFFKLCQCNMRCYSLIFTSSWNFQRLSRVKFDKVWNEGLFINCFSEFGIVLA